MGRNTTPALIVNQKANVRMTGSPEWRTRKVGQRTGYGKPNEANLAKFVAKGDESFRDGGCNFHITESARASGAIAPDAYVVYTSARIVRQSTGEVLASWSA